VAYLLTQFGRFNSEMIINDLPYRIADYPHLRESTGSPSVGADILLENTLRHGRDHDSGQIVGPAVNR